MTRKERAGMTRKGRAGRTREGGGYGGCVNTLWAASGVQAIQQDFAEVAVFRHVLVGGGGLAQGED